MNTRVLLLGCLLALSVQAQETKPGPVPAAAPAARPAAPATSAASVKPAAGVQYQSLEIWQPASGESFFGEAATVNVRMRSEPSLASGDRLLLYLDGKLVEGEPTSYEYTLANLERGVHSLAAVIVDEKGNEKIRSEPRVFNIQLPTTVNPRAVGPNLNPPGKPRPNPGPNKPVPYSGR